jgi:PhzF family phenazine biosynthesis protein
MVFDLIELYRMTKVKIFLLKSFGVNETGGNPAGVVLSAENLTDGQKKAISKEVNFSETAFIEVSDKADFKVRFFTPTEEVDLCGHATIAAYSLLFQRSLLKSGSYKQELKAGVLGIEVQDDGLVIMEQSLPQFSESIPLEVITDVFDESIIVDGLTPQIVSTGLRDIMLPVQTRNQLFSFKPDFGKMADMNKKTNSIGVHAFTLDTIDPKAIAHCRNFAPLYGITEESATGSSNGALACYLYHHRKLNDRSLHDMKFEQGYSMNKPSEIFVGLEVDGQQIAKVTVGGRAILFGEKEIEI